MLVRYVGGGGVAHVQQGAVIFFLSKNIFRIKTVSEGRPHLGLLSIFEIGFKVRDGRGIFSFLYTFFF